MMMLMHQQTAQTAAQAQAAQQQQQQLNGFLLPLLLSGHAAGAHPLLSQMGMGGMGLGGLGSLAGMGSPPLAAPAAPAAPAALRAPAATPSAASRRMVAITFYKAQDASFEVSMISGERVTILDTDPDDAALGWQKVEVFAGDVGHVPLSYLQPARGALACFAGLCARFRPDV